MSLLRQSTLALLTLALAAGCRAEAEPKTVVEIEAVPFEHTTVLDEDSMALVVESSADAGVLRFEGSTTAIDELAPGRVIVGVPSEVVPHGVLRRVEQVERIGDEVVVTSSPTSPIFAFRRLAIHVDHPRGVALPESLRASESLPVDVEVNWVVFDGDGKDSTVLDRVTVVGNLSASAGFDFDMGFDWGELIDIDNIFDLNPFDVLDDIGFYVDFEAQLSASADIDFEGASVLEFADEIDLAPPAELGVIWIPGTPVWIIPRIHPLAHVSGASSSRFSGHLSQEGSLAVGVEIEGSDLPQLTGGIPKFSATQPSATLQASANVRASVEPRLELLVWGLAGPHAGIEPYVELDADIDRDPCWTLHGGVDANFGVSVDLLLVSYAKSFPVNLADEQLADGECELPPGMGGGSLDPKFTPWASAYPGSTQQVGDRDDRSRVTRTHDGKLVVGSSWAQGLFKVELGGAPVWGREFVRDLEAGPYTVRPRETLARLDGRLWTVAEDATVLDLDAAGQLEQAWLPDFLDPSSTRMADALRTDDGGLIMVGSSAFGDARHGWIARLGPTAELQWARTMTGELEEEPDAVVEVPEGWLVSGWASEAGAQRGFALLLDPSGQTIWIHRLADCETVDGLFERDVEIHTALMGEEGHYILGGSTLYGEYRSLMLAMSPEGEVLWSTQNAESTFLGLDLRDMVMLESGGYMNTGVWVWSGANDGTYVAETDATGRIAWLQVYRGDSREIQPSLLALPERNGMLVAGVTDSSFAAGVGVWMSELPRKDGVIELPPGIGLERLELTPVEATSCIESVEWPGSVVALEGSMVELDDVEVGELALDVLPLAP